MREADHLSTSLTGTSIVGEMREGYEQVLTPDALAFLVDLHRTFSNRFALELLRRKERQRRFDQGEPLDFPREMAPIRSSRWEVAPIPKDLEKRTVEITGPVDRKMIINALNSGADCFMADFEDSSSPTWSNMVEGQLHLSDAVRRTIRFKDEARDKTYELNDKVATLLVRPRGIHLPEENLLIDGDPIPGALFDFGLYFYHNAYDLLALGSGPYFYLPKLESYKEARLWNDVFVHAQKRLGIPEGTIKATVLIETLPAAFEMDEILYELRQHSSGLNCGRWDYIFSFIKTHRHDPIAVLPDRSEVTMTQPFMRAYSQLVIKTCHRRGVHAMGGMAAQIPIKGDAVANAEALRRVKADKLREVMDGHDGTWVAHPALVPLAREIFESALEGPNQIHRKRGDVEVTPEDLTQYPAGTITEEGLRLNIRVGVQYLESWLRGAGCVPLYNLMEDAATAEISRAQIWQMLRHRAQFNDGRPVTYNMFEELLEEELHRIRGEVGEQRWTTGRFEEAQRIFSRISTADKLEDFLTLAAYPRLA